MKEKLKSLAESLYQGENILDTYKELAEIFEQNCLFHEEGAVYERIWHLTQDNELYKKIGDIFFYKVRNKDISIRAYHLYLQHSNPEFYKSYADNLNQIGLHDFKYKPDDEDYTRELVNLCDRYNALIYIMVCLHKNREFNSILELKNYLFSIREKINRININSDEDNDTIQEILESNIHLSALFSETEHHNDLNFFAIELNPDNQKAYINILGDYITYKKYEEAIEYFNSNYAPKYNIHPIYNQTDICWVISDYYRDNFKFFESVNYQKIALETDI